MGPGLPGVAPPRQRLRAIRLLTDAGIAAGVALAPVLPGLTDAPRQLAAVLAAARDAGATYAWTNVLKHFLSVVEREWPDELDRYRQLYPAAESGYLRRADASPIEARLAAVRRGSGIADRRRIILVPPPEPEQLPLAL